MTPQDPSPAPSAPADLARLLDLYESTARAVGLAIGARTHADVDEKRAAAARGLVDAAFRALVEERDQWRHIGHLAEKAVEYARSQRAAALSRADESDAALRLSQEAMEVCVACENAERARAEGAEAALGRITAHLFDRHRYLAALKVRGHLTAEGQAALHEIREALDALVARAALSPSSTPPDAERAGCPKCGGAYTTDAAGDGRPRFACDACGHVWTYGGDGGKYASARASGSEDAAPVICPRCQVTNWDPLAAAAHARWCTAPPVTPTNEDHDHE